ncbi:MAG: PilX N-terminal domain-containing pilus assembly protein [Gammaproteobacteria bacterium]|nr:PilX N-terminal domain-containing pilus assembly protein [Gammaproteobacteria bacterium]
MNIKSNQNGAVLVISLIILLVMTVLGVTSLRSATMEEKMSGNTFDRQLAFQAAEAALRSGERDVETNPTQTLDENCNAGVCTNPREQDVSGWQEDPSHAVWASAQSVDVVLNGIRTTAKYMIEDMCEFTPPSGATDSRRMFRITAYATGGTDASQVMLQSAYAVDNNYGATPNCNCNDASYCTVCGGINCTP